MLRAKEPWHFGHTLRRFDRKALDSIPKISVYLPALWDDAHKDTYETGTLNYCPVSSRPIDMHSEPAPATAPAPYVTKLQEHN